MFNAVWTGDADAVTEEMTKLLRKTISYHDYREDFYHAFLAGIFAGDGYTVDSNKSMAKGEAMLLFMMRPTAALQSLKRSIPGTRNFCCLNVIVQSTRSMSGCMQRNMQMIMMKFFVMESLSLKNAAL